MTAMKMICRMSPSTNAPPWSGMMWVRNRHHSWFSPFSIRPPTVSETSIVAGVGVDALAQRDEVDREQPEAERQQVADLEVDEGFHSGQADPA